MSFYSDPEKLDYPAADRLVEEYLRTHAQRPRTTTVAVLEWSDYPNDQHNRKRVYDALSRVARPTDENWAGRVVFRVEEP